MLSKASLILLLGLTAVALAHFDSEEYGGPRQDRRSHRPWFMMHRGRFGMPRGGDEEAGPRGPWMPPMGPMGPPPSHRGRFHKRGYPFPPPPFLRAASEDARKEFFQIFEQGKATKGQVKEQVRAWAAKQPENVQAIFADFERNLTTIKTEAKKNATNVILQLETALDRFTTILEDESLTQKETFEKLRNAARSFDRDVIVATKFIMKNAHRRIAAKVLGHPERRFGRPEGMPSLPSPRGGFPFPPPPPPHGGPEGPIDPFFPPPPPPKEDEIEDGEDLGGKELSFLPDDF